MSGGRSGKGGGSSRKGGESSKKSGESSSKGGETPRKEGKAGSHDWPSPLQTPHSSATALVASAAALKKPAQSIVQSFAESSSHSPSR